MKPKRRSSDRLAETSRGHWRGLQLRLGLIRASLFRRTNDLLEDSHDLLEGIGIQYEGLQGDLTPFDLLRRLPRLPSTGDVDFSALDVHRFALEGDALAGDWSSELEVAHFLGELVVAKRAKRVVELGCFIGRTSSYLAQGLQSTHTEASLICVDVSAKHLEVCGRNLGQLGLSEPVRFVCGESTAPSTLELIPNDLDLLYIDSFHDYDNTIREFEAYGPKMASDGWIVLHDAVKWPGVRKAVRTMQGGWALAILATSEGNGLAILIRR